MRRAIKLATYIGAASLIVAGAASAGSPTAFGQWSVAAGTIAATCPASFICTNVTSPGSGFLQRKLTAVAVIAGNGTTNTQAAVAIGDIFFQTIITDTGATSTTPLSTAWTANSLGFFD